MLTLGAHYFVKCPQTGLPDALIKRKTSGKYMGHCVLRDTVYVLFTLNLAICTTLVKIVLPVYFKIFLQR